MSVTLGSVIHDEREAAHLTQRELARMVKVSNSTISRIESDDGIHPDPPTLKAISEVLKIDYNYLLALNGQIADDPDIRMIQRGAKNLSADDRRRMMRTLNAMFDDLFTEEKSGGDTPS
ncbi:MAG: helix-turn-helix domain-containing protein [Lachnospiraceae bacterium]|nr:helix-turn-helix domain-containing protein [Lachnospiraceae bacterium]